MTRRLWRLALAVPLLAIGLGTASAAARVGPAEPLCAQAESAYRAGVVVELGNGQVVRQCVGFATPTITVLALLTASKIEFKTESYGGLGEAICQIDDEPPSYTTCLPTSGSFWVFFVSRGGGAWTSASQGVSTVTVGNGDDAGFRYDPLAGADPPPVSPAGTCSTATPTPSPTARPTPEPTAKPTPAGTAPPGGTATPTTPAKGAGQPSPSGNAAVEPNVTDDPTSTAGQASPVATASPVTDVAPSASISSPFTPGLLLAALVVAALVGLLGVQGIRRRRR